MSLSIEQVSSEDGDWTVILVDGKVHYEGHSIPDFYWRELLRSFGVDIYHREISPKDMEEGNYYGDKR